MKGSGGDRRLAEKWSQGSVLARVTVVPAKVPSPSVCRWPHWVTFLPRPFDDDHQRAAAMSLQAILHDNGTYRAEYAITITSATRS